MAVPCEHDDRDDTMFPLLAPFTSQGDEKHHARFDCVGGEIMVRKAKSVEATMAAVRSAFQTVGRDAEGGRHLGDGVAEF